MPGTSDKPAMHGVLSGVDCSEREYPTRGAWIQRPLVDASRVLLGAFGFGALRGNVEPESSTEDGPPERVSVCVLLGKRVLWVISVTALQV